MKKTNNKVLFINIISIMFFALGIAAITGTIWGTKTFGELVPDQMIINLFSPRDGTSNEIMSTLWKGPVLYTFILTVLFAVFVFFNKYIRFCSKGKERKLFTVTAKRIISFVLALVVFMSGIGYGIYQFELTKIVKMYTVNDTFIEDNFVAPNKVKMQFPEKKRNLIHIYLESMENSYTSTDLGGYMDENLIKPLTDLASEGISFSHLDKGFGGPVATTGGVWSVAAMVNMNAGIPMKAPIKVSNYGALDDFLPGTITIGDILASQGYEQTIMFGATAKFGGLNYFYESHGNFNILDYDAAKEKGWIPEDYFEFWGYEDDKLYEFAKKELVRLSETGKPFNFVMETADTHFPDGYVGKNTPTPRNNQYANVIAYSASEVVKFVRWIQEQPFYENTTIVIIGDHNSMDKKFFKTFDKNYIRTTFNLFLNIPEDMTDNITEEITQNRWWANFDMFPTILASIGVKIEGERLGIGTNMFSGVETVFERNGGKEGWQKTNDLLILKSDFYNENILSGKGRVFNNKNITYY